MGLRRRTYNVLSGSVLSVWSRVENVLAQKTGHNSKMQVVRLRTGEGVKIVGRCTRRANIFHICIMCLD